LIESVFYLKSDLSSAELLNGCNFEYTIDRERKDDEEYYDVRISRFTLTVEKPFQSDALNFLLNHDFVEN
jgi:hypothetical protein